MDNHDRSNRLFDKAKKLGMVNPMTSDGAPNREMVAEVIMEAESDASLVTTERQIVINEPFNFLLMRTALKDADLLYEDERRMDTFDCLFRFNATDQEMFEVGARYQKLLSENKLL
jgi:hypothetical protein